MKKSGRLFMAATAVVTLTLFTGCFNNGGGNNGNSLVTSEPVSVVTVENNSETDWNKPEPESGMFPGGLDDDGREPGETDVMAVSIDFENVNIPDKAMHKAVITGNDADGNLVWTYETPEIGIGQLDNLQDIMTTNTGYLFLQEGTIVCLDLYTGEVSWTNSDFGGASVSWTTDYEGKNLYICGYYGPDLFVMDLSTGETVNRITNDKDCYWCAGISYINEHQVDIYYEGNDQILSFDPQGPSVQ